jgi:two-component system cell cycle response regulator CtrA
VDVDARLEAIEAENLLLRERVDQLETLLGWRMPAPLAFSLTPSEAKVFGVLMQRDLATKKLILGTLYGDRPDGGAEDKIADVFVCKIRAKLKRFGVEIETVWGTGWRMSPATKELVREMMQSEGLAA